MDEFYIRNVGAGFLGNSPIWWQKGGSGYTQWLDDAKRFSNEEADGVIQSCLGTHQFEKWPCKKVDDAAKLTVDIQDLS